MQDKPYSLSYLHEFRATTRTPSDAAAYQYCRLRGSPGATGHDESWGNVTYLFEVDGVGMPVRQLQIYDRALFTYRFNLDNPFLENYTGERFGGGLRTTPLSSQEIEDGRITHEQFEHAWLTGQLGERTVAQYRAELLFLAFEDAPMLWEAWAQAEMWYPYQGPGSTLTLAERSIAQLLEEGLIDLVDMRGGSELVAADLVPYPSSSWEAILADRRSWLIPATMWFHVTQEGITYLQAQRRIY